MMRLPEMTPGEKREIQRIMQYQQPICPVCHKPMKLGVERLSDGRYIADYSSPCGWRITPQRAKIANMAALNAYTLAVKRYV